MNISLLIVNRFQKSHFIIIIMRIFIIFIKFIILIVKFIIVFSSSIFSKFIKMRIIREHFKYKIIQKIFNNHKNFIISNLRNLLFNSLTKTFAIFAFFTNYINKLNIFKLIIYE